MIGVLPAFFFFNNIFSNPTFFCVLSEVSTEVTEGKGSAICSVRSEFVCAHIHTQRPQSLLFVGGDSGSYGLLHVNAVVTCEIALGGLIGTF